MSEEKLHRFCPQCGSTDLKWLLGGRLGDQYKCMKCAYQGPAFLGDKKFISRAKQKI